MMDSTTKNALVAELNKTRNVSFTRYGSTEAEIILAGFRALSALAVPLAPVVGAVNDLAESVSFTFPTPFGTVIYLSKNAVQNSIGELCTTCHELVHADQIAEAGAIQAAQNYALSSPNRAKLEADADGAAMFCAYLFGYDPDVPTRVEHLRGRLYHIDDADIVSAKTDMELHLATILHGSVPAISVARDLIVAARKICPQLIVPTAFRP